MKSEAGQTNIEYQLIMVILAIGLIGLLTFFASDVNEFYADTAGLVGDALAKATGTLSAP